MMTSSREGQDTREARARYQVLRTYVTRDGKDKPSVVLFQSQGRLTFATLGYFIVIICHVLAFFMTRSFE